MKATEIAFPLVGEAVRCCGVEGTFVVKYHVLFTGCRLMFPASDKVWSALRILDHLTESVLSQQVASALGLTRVQCVCSDDVRGQDHVRLDKPWHLMLWVWYEMLSSLHCSYTSTQGASRQVCSTACCGSSTHCEIQCCYRGISTLLAWSWSSITRDGS